MFNRSVFISIAIFCGTTSASIAADSKYCTTENFARVSKLYENRTHETAKTIFSVLNCGGGLSKKTKRAQFTALVGGLMHVSPELIDDIYSSAQEAGNLEAPKIFLDALWFCASDACKSKLKARPFSLPEEDITALLQESPPDPYSYPIASPADLDFLWGYFGGTGDTKVVQRIFDFVRSNWKYYETSEQIGVERRTLIGSARWSLTSMASQDQRVKSVLEAARTTSPEAVILLEIVEKDSGGT